LDERRPARSFGSRVRRAQNWRAPKRGTCSNPARPKTTRVRPRGRGRRRADPTPSIWRKSRCPCRRPR
jgi:hypothetical protein